MAAGRTNRRLNPDYSYARRSWWVLNGSLFEQGQIRELISTHAATSPESSEAYLRGDLKVEQFYPMGTWAEKVRAGAMGLGGVLVPVGVGILDQPGIFPEMINLKQVIELNGRSYFVEEALRADVSIIKGWRADPLGNVQFRSPEHRISATWLWPEHSPSLRLTKLFPLALSTPRKSDVPARS